LYVSHPHVEIFRIRHRGRCGPWCVPQRPRNLIPPHHCWRRSRKPETIRWHHSPSECTQFHPSLTVDTGYRSEEKNSSVVLDSDTLTRKDLIYFTQLTWSSSDESMDFFFYFSVSGWIRALLWLDKSSWPTIVTSWNRVEKDDGQSCRWYLSVGEVPEGGKYFLYRTHTGVFGFGQWTLLRGVNYQGSPIFNYSRES
jgi:hypothetical protein